MTKLVGLMTTLFLLTSCGNYGNSTSPSGRRDMGAGQGNGQQVKTNLDFATIREEILEPHCISCHTGRHQAYADYNIVKASAFAMLDRMQSENPVRRMPKDAAALDSKTLARFTEWVNAGAPEFASEEEEKPDTKKPENSISFQEIKKEILQPYNCTACHSQFNDYAPVAQAIGSIASLVTSNVMPFPRKKNQPVAPVSQKHKDLLLAWVAQGAPEFADRPALLPIKEQLQPTWVSLRNNVFGPKCILCHNSYGNRGAGLNLGTMVEIREAMLKNPDLINTQSANDSHLIGAILGRVDDDELFFDPMPFNNSFDDVQSNIPAVTETELKQIEKWIELKLPYNEDEL